MSLTTIHLKDAAEMACVQSVNGRTVEIIASTEGMIVRGFKGDKGAGIDLQWPELDAEPSLLVNAVYLIARRLP